MVLGSNYSLLFRNCSREGGGGGKNEEVWSKGGHGLDCMLPLGGLGVCSLRKIQLFWCFQIASDAFSTCWYYSVSVCKSGGGMGGGNLLVFYIVDAHTLACHRAHRVTYWQEKRNNSPIRMRTAPPPDSPALWRWLILTNYVCTSWIPSINRWLHVCLHSTYLPLSKPWFQAVHENNSLDSRPIRRHWFLSTHRF